MDADEQQRLAELEAKVEAQQSTLEKMLPGRRAVLAGLAGAGAGAVGMRSATDDASAQAVGQIGTDSEPVDVEAETVDASAVNADDLDIGGSDLLSSGDFAAIGPTLAWQKTQQTSTSSTSYVTVDQNEANVIWDNWEPSGATTAVLSMFRVSGGTNADVRLNNPVNSEAVFEGNFADGESVTRTDTYTPTSASSRTLYQFEFRQPDGNSTILARAQATAGVQL